MSVIGIYVVVSVVMPVAHDGLVGMHLQAPLIHTAWHLMSAVGLAATGCFLDDIDHHGNAFL